MSVFMQDKITHIQSRQNPDLVIMDNSSLNVWGDCQRKFLYQTLLSLRETTEKPALTFGRGFHKFLEFYYSDHTFEDSFAEFVKVATKENSKITLSKDESIANGQNQELSLEFAFLLCKKYTETHPKEREYFTVLKDPDNNYYLEMGFAIDLHNGILIGMIDGIATINNTKQEIVLEHKTTSYNINSSYLSDFNPNNQISTYLYAATEFLGRPINTALVNVIRVKDYKRGDPSTNDEKLFGRLETSRDPEQLEQRMRHADFQMKQIKQSIDAGLDGFPQNTQACRSRFGECPYRRLCMAKSETMLQILAETTYTPQPWSPYNVFDGVDKVVEIDVRNEKVDVKPADIYLEKDV